MSSYQAIVWETKSMLSPIVVMSSWSVCLESTAVVWIGSQMRRRALFVVKLRMRLDLEAALEVDTYGSSIFDALWRANRQHFGWNRGGLTRCRQKFADLDENRRGKRTISAPVLNERYARGH
jgi:hypothetical protein